MSCATCWAYEKKPQIAQSQNPFFLAVFTRLFFWRARDLFLCQKKKDYGDDDELMSEETRALWCELVDLSDAWHELNSDLSELKDEHERDYELELESSKEEQEEEGQCLDEPDDLD